MTTIHPHVAHVSEGKSLIRGCPPCEGWQAWRDAFGALPCLTCGGTLPKAVQSRKFGEGYAQRCKCKATA